MRTGIVGGLVALLAYCAPASGQQLNVICPVQAEWCSLAATEFEKETGIKVGVTLKGSGESFAQVAAEKANPKAGRFYHELAERLEARRLYLDASAYYAKALQLWPQVPGGASSRGLLGRRRSP